MDKCAFDGELDCRALREKKCAGCSFYKTEGELLEGREKALDRIANLPKDKRAHILRTYYERGGDVAE